MFTPLHFLPQLFPYTSSLTLKLMASIFLKWLLYMHINVWLNNPNYISEICSVHTMLLMCLRVQGWAFDIGEWIFRSSLGKAVSPSQHCLAACFFEDDSSGYANEKGGRGFSRASILGFSVWFFYCWRLPSGSYTRQISSLPQSCTPRIIISFQ